MAELRVKYAESPERRVRLTGRAVIGRGEDCQVFLPDAWLSRRHAIVTRKPDGYWVEDMGSTNGSYLNGQRLERPSRLRPGDVIRVGESKITFEDDEESPADQTAVLGARSYSLEELSVRSTKPTFEVAELVAQNRVLNILTRVSGALLHHYATEELFDKVLDLMLEAVPAERAAILLIVPGRKDPQVKASRSRGDALPLKVVSRAIARRVIEEKIALLLPEVLEDAAFRTSDSLTQLGVRSALCVPLWVIEENEQSAPRILGLVYLDSRAPVAPFSEMDLQILTVIANVAAAKIETARLLDESREKKQLEHDMKIAAEIQTSLQPVKPPQDVPGYRVSGMSRSCRAVGGDYYDFMFDGQRLHMALGDVSGKGYGAAMLMTALRASTRSHWVDGTPVDAMARINRAFHQCVPSDKYATLFLGRLHARSGRLVYVNAGHNPPILVRANGEVELLPIGGTIVGSFEGSSYEEAVVEIRPGDTILVYSDGISDAWPTLDAAERALAEYVRHGRTTEPAHIAELVFQATERTAGGGREDDRTLVIVRREPY